MEIREITADYDRDLAAIIRHNFEKHGLNIPGTVYFDPELDHLSSFYLAKPEKRRYFVLVDGDKVCGGMGFAEFDGFDNCTELQKLYLSDSLKGKGYGRELFNFVENEAAKLGYKRLYIETHTSFKVALSMYLRYGYEIIEKPETVSHGAMNRFLIKDI